MIVYNEGRWGIGFALQLHGSVVDRCLVLALPCALLAVSLNLLKDKYPESGFFRQLEGDMGASVHSGFSFVLGFLIVFRTQQAYSRWWEGGTLLQQLRGEWFNAFSNLMAFLNHDDDAEIQAKVEVFKHKMARLFSLLYGTGLEQVHTMNTPPLMQYINPAGFQHVAEFMHSKETHDPCELVLQWIQRLIVEANTDDLIKIAPPILARVYNQLGQGIVTLNRARKIKEFHVPFNLAQLIAILLILHWTSTAIVCAIMLSNPVMAGITAFTICFSFWGVNYIAVELENPFGDDSNDLPLVEMQEDMNQSIISLLRPHAISPPKFDFVVDRDLDLEKALTTHFTALVHGESTFSFRFSKKPAPVFDRCCDDFSKKPGPVVDRCCDGNCYSGSGTFGWANDPSYRDSVLAGETAYRDGAQRQPPAKPGMAPVGHGQDASPLAAATVGRQEAVELPPSPAHSQAALLPRARPGAAPGRGEWNRGAQWQQHGLCGADLASGSSQACRPGSPSRGSAPDRQRGGQAPPQSPAGLFGRQGQGPPQSPASLLGGVAGSLCLGGPKYAGADRPAGSGQRGGAPAPGHDGELSKRTDWHGIECSRGDQV